MTIVPIPSQAEFRKVFDGIDIELPLADGRVLSCSRGSRAGADYFVNLTSPGGARLLLGVFSRVPDAYSVFKACATLARALGS